MVVVIRTGIAMAQNGPLPVSTLGLSRTSVAAFSPDLKHVAFGDLTVVYLVETSNWTVVYTLEGHTDSVNRLSFSADGRMLASGGMDKALRLWDVGTGREILVLHGTTCGALAFSPDGSQLAAQGEGETVKLWDVETGQEILVLHGTTCGALAFSPDGSQLAAGSGEAIKLWDVETGQEIRALHGNPSGVAALAFSPDGSQLAAGSGEAIKLWDVSTGWEIRTLDEHVGRVTSIAYSPDGKLVAAGVWETTPDYFSPKGQAVVVWDISDGTAIAEALGQHYSRTSAVAFSADGRSVAWAEGNRYMGRLNTLSGDVSYWEQLRIGHRDDSVTSVAFSPDGTLLASGPGSQQKIREGDVILWDVASGQERQRLPGHSSSVNCIAFSPDGRLLAAGLWVDREAKVWDLETGEELLSLHPNLFSVYAAAFSPDGTVLATGEGQYAGPGKVTLWDIPSGKPLRVLEGHTKDVLAVAFSPDGRLLASGSADKDVRLWMVETGWVTTLAGHRAPVKAVMFSDDGMYLMTSGGKDVITWDVESREEISRVALDRFRYSSGASPSVDFTSDGRFVVISGQSFIALYDTSTGKQLATLTGHTANVQVMAFSPSGLLLASGADDAKVKLWEISDITGGGPSTKNEAPDGPTSASQSGFVSRSEIPVGGTVSENTILLRAVVSDPDGDRIRLQVDIRPVGESFDTTERDLITSSDGQSGSELTCAARDLPEGFYHWRARAIDDSGNTSDWLEFGENLRTEADFAVALPDTEAPACVVELRDIGTTRPRVDTEVGRQIGIFLGDSSDDTGIVSVRFSSDEAQDSLASGEWTEFYNWSYSSGGWSSTEKSMSWSFATPGEKEVWVEARDTSGNSAQCSISVFAHPGYAIVVAGQGGWREKSGIDHAANNAYRALRNLGFQDDHITYLNAASSQDIDSDGDNEVDGIASLATFSDAVHELAGETEGTSTPVLIYLVGHGNPDCFVFDEDDSENGFLWVGQVPGIPGLEELLSEFDDTVPCAVVVGSCHSGCFITTTETSGGSISAMGRVIVTSAHDDDPRSLWGWVRSSDTLWADLMKGADLRTAFESRTLPGDISHLWLDDNGDQVGHPPSNLADDGDVAERFKVGMPGSDSLKLKSWLFYWLRSPGELRVCDANGRVTGLVDGQVREEIPDSLFDAEEDMVVLFAPPESYYCEVVGTAAGTYDLEGVFVYDGQDYSVAAEHMPALPGSVHRYSVDWDAIAEGEAGMTLQVDAAGDGEFEETHQSTDYFDGDSLQPSAPAESQAPEGGFPTWLIGVGVAVLILVAVLLGFRLRRAR